MASVGVSRAARRAGRPALADERAAPAPVTRPPAATPGGEPPGAEHPDAALVARVQAGDMDAYGTLVRDHLRRAFALAYRVMGQREDAEDLVQDAFLVALERIQSFEAGRPFGPWFFRILVNRGLNARRSRAVRRTEQVPDEAPARTESPAVHAERMELRGRLRTALDALPERQRVAIEMFELEGFTSAEIGEVLGIPDGTVRWYLHQARRTLRGALAPLEGESDA